MRDGTQITPESVGRSKGRVERTQPQLAVTIRAHIITQGVLSLEEREGSNLRLRLILILILIVDHDSRLYVCMYVGLRG